MKLTEKTIERETDRKFKEDSKQLVLDGLNINSADIIEKYKNLEYLSLRFNLLSSIEFILNCHNLWVLELQQNPVLLLPYLDH